MTDSEPWNLPQYLSKKVVRERLAYRDGYRVDPMDLHRVKLMLEESELADASSQSATSPKQQATSPGDPTTKDVGGRYLSAESVCGNLPSWGARTTSLTAYCDWSA